MAPEKTPPSIAFARTESIPTAIHTVIVINTFSALEAWMPFGLLTYVLQHEGAVIFGLSKGED